MNSQQLYSNGDQDSKESKISIETSHTTAAYSTFPLSIYMLSIVQKLVDITHVYYISYIHVLPKCAYLAVQFVVARLTVIATETVLQYSDKNIIYYRVFGI